MKVHRVGGSLMVSIPAASAQRLRIQEGDEVDVQERESELIVRPVKPLRKLLDSWEPIGPPLDMEEVVQRIREERESH